MTIKISPIPAFNDNYIWLIQDGQSALVVDPGDAGPVKQALNAQNLSLVGVLITHHHWDHTGGLSALLAQQPDLIVWGPQNPAIKGVTHRVADGDTVQTPLKFSLRVLSVPGHTLDHIAYYSDDARDTPILFCGDTLFSSGCGRLFEGTPAQMHASLSRLRDLPDTTEVYCTHEYTTANLAFAQAVEPENADLAQRAEQVAALRAQNQPSLPSNLALEKRVNPFIRWDEPSVKAAAEQHSGRSQPNATAVFAALRSWKDQF